MGGHHRIELGQQGADEDKLISEVTTFVAACYGSNVDGYIHDYSPLPDVEVTKMANSKITSAFKCAAFVQHVHRA